MADQKQQIVFQKTMTADKREQEACYLRHNLFASRSKGLYPARDFSQNAPVDVFSNGAVLEKTINSLMFVQDGADLKIYFSSNAPKGTYTLAHTLVNHSFYDAVYGNDEIHLLARSGAPLEFYKVNYDATTVTSIGSQAGTMSGGRALFDGLYYFYFFADKIYRQLNSDVHTLVFNDTASLPDSVDVFGDRIVLFFTPGNTIKVAFWDKADTDLYDKVVNIKNATFIAGGTVDGALVLLKGVGNSTNIHERNGEIVAGVFDGEKFERTNSIKAGSKTVTFKESAIGDEVMVVALASNDNSHNEILYNNFILKVNKKGEIEVMHTLATTDDVTSLDIHYDYMTFGLRGVSGGSPTYYHNADSVSAYGSYVNYANAEYITNFLNNPYNTHKLQNLAIVFEKLFDAGASEEKIIISYRVSERDDFTVLATITAENVKDNVDSRMSQTAKDAEYNDDTVGLTHQVYMNELMPDGTSLPEFNEIQFKFELSEGFSVIDAWYYYDYITRNSRL